MGTRQTAGAARRELAAAVLLLALAAPARAEPPLDPRVTPETLAGTVCVHGYTRTVRPAWRWLRRLKERALAGIGRGPEDAGAYQLDHVVPLVLGGAPADPANLQLQERSEAKKKDHVERVLGCLVCKGEIALHEARAVLGHGDWRQGWSEWRKVRCWRE